jgi:hypothetical protein
VSRGARSQRAATLRYVRAWRLVGRPDISNHSCPVVCGGARRSVIYSNRARATPATFPCHMVIYKWTWRVVWATRVCCGRGAPWVAGVLAVR